jgi:hypothetical protein
MLVDEGHPIERVSDLVDALWIVLTTIWAFKVRNRINSLLATSAEESAWFKGLWTFLFGAFYINFKINKMHERLPNQAL